MSTQKLPDDYFHTFIYVMLDAATCSECERDPGLIWAWDEIKPSEDAADVFTIRAVAHLKSTGWIMHVDELLCPQCAAKRGFMG